MSRTEQSMIKRVLFAAIIVASTTAAAYALSLLDTIIHSTLYSYGLQFSYEWANPYWTLIRIIQVLLSIVAVTTIIGTLFSVRTLLRHAVERRPKLKAPLASKTTEKASIMARTTERTPIAHNPPSQHMPSTTAPLPLQTTQPLISKPTSAPTPITASPPSHPATDLPGVFKCGHCGKNFTQPLRMLDFNSERPRIVNICPFCNEIANTSSQTEEEEQKQNAKSPSSRKNHMTRTIAR